MTADSVELEIETRHERPYLIQPEEGPARALIVYLHWFDEAPNANRSQFVEEAKSMAGHGIASVLPQLTFPWKEPPSTLERDVKLLEAEHQELRDVVARASEVTGTDRLVIVGHDFGAMHGAILARSLTPECAVFIAATPRWADWFLPFWPIEGDRYDYMRGLERFDPIVVLEDLSAPKLFQFSKADFYIAPMSGMGLVSASAEPHRLESYETDHAMNIEACRNDRTEFILENLGIRSGADS